MGGSARHPPPPNINPQPGKAAKRQQAGGEPIGGASECLASKRSGPCDVARVTEPGALRLLGREGGFGAFGDEPMPLSASARLYLEAQLC
jgi:hypothetical protein